jgi:membrane-associated phospholipid phosphatase
MAREGMRALVSGGPTAAALVLLLAWAAPAGAQGASEQLPAAQEAAPKPDQRTLRQLPQNWFRGLYGVFDRGSVAPLLVGGLASGGALLLDDDVRRAAASPTSGFGKTLETAGGTPNAVLVAGLFTAGRLVGNESFRAMSYDLAEAAVVNGVYTQVLKLAVRRERPDGSNNASFPSGHTSNAFALATVVECHYGWKGGVPAYVLAAVMGYSRIVRDKHYLSDVAAGATLGVIVGRAAVRGNGGPIPAGAKRSASWIISPVLTRDARGLALSIVF